MILIEVTPLSYRIKVHQNGQLIGTYLNLGKHLRKFEHTTWDRRLFRMVLQRRYVYYNKDTQTLYVPRFDLDAFCRLLEENSINYKIVHLPLQEGKSVDIRLKDGVYDRSEQQTAAIKFLTTHNGSLRGLSSTTGFGKTYCAVKTVSIIGRRAMFCVMGLVDQWKNAIFQFTELTEEDVYIIKGAQSMKTLLTEIDKTLFPKIIIASIGTIRNYALNDETYEEFPPFTDIFDILRVGVKGIDEAHLSFHATLMIDLQTNAEINIALTATFLRTEQQVAAIFDAHYPRLIRFGENEFTRYIEIYSYSFSAGGIIPQKAYMTAMGYNHSKLEEWLLRKDKKILDYIFRTVYSPAIFGHYINRKRVGQRLLIICSSVVMCEWFYQKLSTVLPKEENLSIVIYIEGVEDDVLSTYDIIISTPKKGGTGRDIKDLRTVLMTVATGAETTNLQSLGRLRELRSTGDTPIYIYTWCRDIRQHNTYHQSRKLIYSERGREFHEIRT